jgi:glycosyltransferase involved in cell wall biosynthesis
VVDDVNGFLVPADNDGELGEMLAILINDCDLRERMGRCSQAVAAEKFSKETFVEQYFSLYNLLLSSKNAQVN